MEESSIFISYAHGDHERVDRLEADLRARGFNPWVDRNYLRVGQHWPEEIAAAIQRSHHFLLVLTPRSVDEPSYVTQEVQVATQHGKTILPLVFEAYLTHPEWLASIEQHTQFGDFKASLTDPEAYRRSLNKLFYAIEDPTLPLSSDYDKLYRQARSLLASEPERAAIIFQYILDNRPDMFAGQVREDLTALELQLHQSRVSRLRAQAMKALERGEYEVEVRSLEILASLSVGDPESVAWVEDYLPAARRNSDMLGLYVAAQEEYRDGHIAEATTMLQNLYRRAPYFRDPSGLAKRLGMDLSPYLNEQVAIETKHFQSAYKLLQAEVPAGKSTQDVHRNLQELNYELPDAVGLVDSIITERANALRLQEEARSKSKQEFGALSSDIGYGCGPWIASLIGWEVIAILAAWLGHFQVGPFSIVWIPIALWASFAVVVIVFEALRATLHVGTLNGKARQAKATAHQALEQWYRVAERVHSERIATMKQLHSTN